MRARSIERTSHSPSAFDATSATCSRAEREPRLLESQRVIEVGERVELHRLSAPFAFDAPRGGHRGDVVGCRMYRSMISVFMLVIR